MNHKSSHSDNDRIYIKASPSKALEQATVRPTIWFHGTSKKNHKFIEKNGFHGIAFYINSKDDNTASYFTWLPSVAQHYATKNGVILVVQISLKNPLPLNEFENIWKNNKPMLTKKKLLLDLVAKKKYDGGYLGDECWVWDPKSIIIIGEFKPVK